MTTIALPNDGRPVDPAAVIAHTISPYFARLARIELNKLGIAFLVLAPDAAHSAAAVDLVMRQQRELGALTTALSDELDLRDRLVVAGQALAAGDAAAWDALMAELGHAAEGGAA